MISLRAYCFTPLKNDQFLNIIKCLKNVQISKKCVSSEITFLNKTKLFHLKRIDNIIIGQ